jgi:hypothetical protein
MNRLLAFALSCLFASATSVAAQGVIVDQGRFEIRVGGRPAGSEEFVIRRAGLGSGDALFANGTVSLTSPDRQEIRPLLRVQPLSGAAEEYQVTVQGAEATEIRLGRAGRRYVATIRSEAGAEDREFQARPETRILDQGVAHHYYFVRSEREGREISVLEPRSRRQFTLVAGAATTEDLRLGPNIVTARRVSFTGQGTAERVVWFDRQGRVLRVEISSEGYVAQRSDLVG